MDEKDRKILELLQERADLPIADLAKAVGLSTTPAWRRIQKLEQEGYIRRRVALLDRVRMNCSVSAFVQIRTRHHDSAWLEKFQEAIKGSPEIIGAYRLAGEIDYLLHVVVPDIAAYDRFYKKLIEQVPLADVSASFAMEDIKYTTALPTAFLSVKGG